MKFFLMAIAAIAMLATSVPVEVYAQSGKTCTSTCSGPPGQRTCTRTCY